MTKSSSQFIGDISREYSLYVLDHRAIPALTDGLKSSQRIALWLLRNRTDKIKTIALAGQMIASELYLHGDAAAANAISMLAGPFCNNRPLIRGEGAFGTRANPTSFAAPRYTSVRRSDIATSALYVDLDIIPMVENHDGSNLMPQTFLPLVPFVLLNGVKGMAPGWSTNILPHRYDDLVRAVNEVLTTGRVQTKLIPYYENRNVTVIDQGDNQYIVQGQVERKNTTTVLVTELPPELTLEAFRERLTRMEEEGRIAGFTDRSTKNINIEIKMKRTDLVDLDDDGLIEFLKIRSRVTQNLTVQSIGSGTVRTYSSTDELIRDWTNWRLEQYLTRFENLLQQEQQTLLFWRYVVLVFTHNLTDDLLSFKTKKDFVDAIRRTAIGNIDEPASDEMLDRIVSRPTYKWTAEGLEEAIEHVDESTKLIEEYTGMIASDSRRKKLFQKEISSLLK